MGLIELGSEDAVRDFLRQNASCIVTFSAHWCGPCKASKPALEGLATAMGATVKFAIVYENDLGEAIHSFKVRAFPTYILFTHAAEVKRIEGADMAAVEKMAQGVVPIGGETLGGAGAPVLSPAEARALRLAKLGGAAAAPAPAPAVVSTAPHQQADAVMKMEEQEASGSPAPPVTTAEETAAADDAKDVEMTDATDQTPTKVEEPVMIDPTERLDPEAITTLTESMGFALIRAQKGLLYGNGGTVEDAVEWLMEHQEDDDIDDPIERVAVGDGGVAKSYRCVATGKVFKNMADLELHAHRTGHSNFEESTESIKPLTEEEKAKKIAEIKQLLKAKRAEREELEKVDETEREKQRRNMGKNMLKTKEQLEIEQRKREAQLRRREKDESKRERQRLREELAKDKAERASQGGRLASRLGVEGYKPDGIQYDENGEEQKEDSGAAGAGVPNKAKPAQQSKASAAKFDEYITKISGYRAGGDGGKCLKTLNVIVSKVLEFPHDAKYRSVGTDTNAYKNKVKPFIGAKNLLLACGFQLEENSDKLILSDDADLKVLADAKVKLEAAIKAYG